MEKRPMVIPATAGIQFFPNGAPAFAGATLSGFSA